MKRIFILSMFVFLSWSAFAQQPLYRYYNGKDKKHFFTVDPDEYRNLGNGWAYEGVACRIFIAENKQRGIIKFLRYYNAKTGDHYMTAHFGELGFGTEGYVLEGKAGCISKFRTLGLVPLFEYFNNSSGNHFYTIDKSELGRGFEGYDFVGIAGFVFPK
jgi:hypothetical protein